MTSKSSFLVRLRENNKRRIWVWIVSVLLQLLTYPGVLTIYLSRIRHLNKEGAYVTVEAYRTQMNEVVIDALGFHNITTVMILFLAVCIGIQGFSYLYDRKKVDMYHSVPISSKGRFIVVYINGILAYVLPALISVTLAIIMAALQGALTPRAVAECALAFLMNFLYYMVVYNIVLLAVMLTGHIIITVIAAAVLLLIAYLWMGLVQNFMFNFFDRATTFFDNYDESVFSILDEHFEKTTSLKRMDELQDIAKAVLPLCGKWLVCALIIGALVYFCYSKRPSEAAGKAIAFGKVKPPLKVIISVTAGLTVFVLLYDLSYSNIAVTVFGMIIGTILCAAIMEIIYEFELSAALRHLATTGISAVFTITIFSIFYFDIFSYDTYIPAADKVESVALSLNTYDNIYWNYSDNSIGSIRSVSEERYLRENMFLTDVEPILELAKKGQNIEYDYMTEERSVPVLYRLKSGREVSRSIIVDFADESNAELLDKIVGTKEYREGAYQIVKDDTPLKRQDLQLSYRNGIVECNIPSQEALRVREAWLKDMENFDFSLARNNMLCGYINIFFGVSYLRSAMPVYESFTNTIDVLKENNAYYPQEIRAEDILSLSVTHYYNDEEDHEAAYYAGEAFPAAAQEVMGFSPVTAAFEEPEEVAEICKALYPGGLSTSWNDRRILDYDYSVTVSFKTGTGYSYVKGYTECYFIKDKVPEFVKQRTAFTAGE